jgi:hypothetical protein
MWCAQRQNDCRESSRQGPCSEGCPSNGREVEPAPRTGAGVSSCSRPPGTATQLTRSVDPRSAGRKPAVGSSCRPCEPACSRIGGSSCHLGSRRVRTAPKAAEARTTTTMVYPLHPCFGQRLAVWRGRHRVQGVEVILLELPGDRRQLVPLEWTNERPFAPCPSRRGRPVLFRVEDLLRARAWCDEARSKRTPRRGKQ